MDEVTLMLSVDEVKIIFNALASRPFHEVFEIIGKINDQANQQLHENEGEDHNFLMNNDE